MTPRLAFRAAALLSAAFASALPLNAQVPPPAGRPPAGAPPAGTPADADPRQTQAAIAVAKFQEATNAIQEAHRLMPIAVEKSVIYEETKANRQNGSCEEALAAAKTDSSRARKEFNEARGKASTSFAAAKRAVQELRRLGVDANGVSPLDGLRFVQDMEAIEDCLKALEQKLWKRINSSLTKRNRGYLWRDANAYADKLPASWPSAKASNLVPDDVRVPCIGTRIPMHVMPEK